MRDTTSPDRQARHRQCFERTSARCSHQARPGRGLGSRQQRVLERWFNLLPSLPELQSLGRFDSVVQSTIHSTDTKGPWNATWSNAGAP